MKNNLVKVIVSFVIVSVSFGFTRVLAINNESIKNEINDNNNKIEDLEKEKEDIQGAISSEESSLEEIEKKIDSKRNDLLKASQDVEAFQGEINLLQEDINNIEYEIVNVENEILVKEETLERLIKDQKVQEVLLANRLRNYYKLDITNQYIYMILSSENIFELLNKLHNITILMKLDKDLMNSKKESEENITKEKEVILEYLKEQEERKAEVVNKQVELVQVQKEFIAIKEEEENKMYELQALESEKNDLIASLEGEENNLQGQIQDLITYNKELQAELDRVFESVDTGNEVENPSGDNESGFIRPVTGIITEMFGPRINPVTFEEGFHNGIDYAGYTGEDIFATKGGTVEYSGWISGYGNSIILNHGDGVKSLYAHSSQLLVSVGDAVSQGDSIALVGSTGMSTGPHLHFEIRIDGQPVDPFGYIPY